MKGKITAPIALDEYFASGFEEAENPFITEETRMWGKNVALIGAFSAAGFLLASYASHFYSHSLSSFFLVIVYFLAGTSSLIHSLEEIKEFNINIQVLMTLAAFLSVLIGSEIEGGLLLVLFSLSEALEESVTKKTKGALHTLHKLSPTMAFVVEEDGSIYPKSVKEIALGTKIVVKAGEIVPLDGKVILGSSFVDLSHLTGESVPISKQVGDTVQAGSHNSDGSLTIIVTKTSAESTLAKIIKLITEAQESKPELQRFLDKFGQRYATTVIGLSICFALFLPLIFAIPYLGTEGSIYRALAFLIAASPCALIIATPTAYLSAISACAKKGILLKGGVVLDRLAKCKTLAFDKTGTLTTGKLTCSNLELDGTFFSLEEGLAIAAGLEYAARHPIADAVIAYAKQKNIQPLEVADLKVVPGKGVEGSITLKGENCPALIGSPNFILSHIKNLERREILTKKISLGGHVITLLLVKDTLLIFHFTDEIRNDLINVMKELKKELSLVMLTGDHKENAQFVAKILGIDKVHADLQPEDKLKIVSTLATTSPLAMIGDGINDAPALTKAMVGIAMGEVGSATAIEASDIVLLRDDLSIIHWLYKRSKKTSRVVHQNVTLALGVIGLATILSISGFIPLWLAVILHEGSTVTVGLNSLRLLKK